MFMSPDSLASYPQSGSTVYNLGGTPNGTLANGPIWSYDGYFDFDGADDYLTLGSSAASLVQGKTAVTMGILFKLDATATLRGLIGTLNYGCGQNLGLVASGNSLSFYNDYSSTCYSVSQTIVETGKWIFAVGTYDGTTTKLYGIKDGTMYTSSGGSKTGATNTFGSTFRVMGNHYSSYFTNGQCAQAFVYDRALSEDEIWDLYFKSPVVADNLALALDPGNLISYPKSGGTVYNLVSSAEGTLTNGVGYSQDYGSYFDFDGTNDQIVMDNESEFDFTDAVFTVEYWFKCNRDTGTTQVLVNKARYGANGRSFETYLQSGLSIRVGGYNGSWTYVVGPVIETNKWYHFVFTSDGSGNAYIYLNGDEVASSTSFNTTLANTADPVDIGAYGSGGAPFDGQMGPIRLYSKYLTPQEVTQNYNAERPRFVSSRDITKEGLVLHLDAHDPNSYLSGTTWTDLSGAGNNGTLTNSPVYSTDNGGVFTFDGVDDYVALGNLNTNIYHISLWVYLDSNVTSTKASTGLFYYGGSGASLQSGVSFGSSTGFLTNETLTILNENPNATYQRTGIFDTIPAGWRYISFNWNGSSYDIYIDGDKKTTSAGSSTGHAPLMIASDFELASNYDSNPQFEGKISSVKIYDQALDEHQIISNYNTQSPLYKVQLPRTTTDSLVLNLDAGDTTSYPRTGTTWYDRSGKGNHATLTNGPTYLFENGGVISFDGSDDTANIGSSAGFNITDEMSVFAWVNLDSNSGWKGIFGGAVSGFVHFQLYNGGINVYVYGPAAPYANPDGVTIGTNVWNHIGFTFGNNTLKVYLNGEQLPTEVTGNGSNITSNSDVRVGWAYATSRLMQGKIPSVKVYNKALSSSEVLENYKSTRSRFGNDGYVTSGLVLYLDAGNIDSFDNSSTTWTDLSGQGNNVTLTNGPFFSPNNGGVLVFDGVDDYADIPFDSSLNNNYTTLSVWVKSTFVNGPNSRHYILDGVSHHSMIFVDEPNEINFVIVTPTGTIYAIYDNEITSQDSWINIVGTYDGSSLSLTLMVGYYT
jgi:hypothetical protein